MGKEQEIEQEVTEKTESDRDENGQDIQDGTEIEPLMNANRREWERNRKLNRR